MKSIYYPLIGLGLVSTIHAQTFVDFDDFALWDATNPDIATLSNENPLTFLNVAGFDGLTGTVTTSGTFVNSSRYAGTGFDNRTGSNNTISISFNQPVFLQVTNNTNHNEFETDTLTIGGTWDADSFTIINDNTASGTLPADFSTTGVAVIGPHTSTTGGGTAFPEWTLQGTGTSLDYLHEASGGNQTNAFQIAVTPVPEPSSALLLGLGGLGLLRRRRK